jgi:hypothetical protein
MLFRLGISSDAFNERAEHAATTLAPREAKRNVGERNETDFEPRRGDINIHL